MQNRKLSRRTCLLTFAAAGVSWQAAIAQRPAARVATLNSVRDATQVACRRFQLEPVVSHLDRTVITAIAADPRGELLAIAGDDHAIRILDAQTLRKQTTLKVHKDLIRTLAFDREGRKLVSAGNDGRLVVWNCAENFNVLQEMTGTPAIARVCFSPGGSEFAAVGFSRDVYLIGRRAAGTATLRCDCNDLRAVAYRDDSQILAVGGRSGKLHLYARPSGQSLGEHAIHNGRIHDMQFQRDSNILISVGEDGTVVLFDAKQRRMAKQFPVTSGKLFSVVVLDTHRIAVAGSDNDIRLIDIDNQDIQRLSGHCGSVSALTANGNTLYSGGFDATLRRWTLPDIHDQERIADGDSAVDRQ